MSFCFFLFFLYLLCSLPELFFLLTLELSYLSSSPSLLFFGLSSPFQFLWPSGSLFVKLWQAELSLCGHSRCPVMGGGIFSSEVGHRQTHTGLVSVRCCKAPITEPLSGRIQPWLSMASSLLIMVEWRWRRSELPNISDRRSVFCMLLFRTLIYPVKCNT